MNNIYSGVGYGGDSSNIVGGTYKVIVGGEEVEQFVYPLEDYLFYQGPGNTIGQDIKNLLVDLASHLNGADQGFPPGAYGSTEVGERIVNGYFGVYLNAQAYPNTLEGLIKDLIAYAYANIPTFNPTIRPITGELAIDPALSFAERMRRTREWLSDENTTVLRAAFYRNPLISPTLTGVLDLYQNVLGLTAPVTIGGVTKMITEFSDGDRYSFLLALFNGTLQEYNSLPKPLINITGNAFTDGSSSVGRWASWLSVFMHNTIAITQASKLTGLQALSYEEFYKSFLGTGNTTQTTAEFNAFFAEFVKKVAGDPRASPNAIPGEVGYFNKSWLFDEFTKQVVEKYFQTVGGSSELAPSGSDAGSAKTAILNRIYALLVLMIESLQKVAAAQSDRLTVYTKWQQAYTDLQNKVKYVADKDSRFHTDLANNSTKRSSFNENNQSYTEKIKAYKSVISDDAKNLQTQINQSTDAVNQQSSMATSILQEIAAILNSLWK